LNEKSLIGKDWLLGSLTSGIKYTITKALVDLVREGLFGLGRVCLV
jgi:hypothetical protein